MSSDDLENLFGAPPASFIAERNRLVAALKSAGRKDEARAVEKIPRPSVAVWTVNQIARRDPELVRRLGAITERLQTAAGAEYGAAAAELRQTLDDLRAEAAAVLAAARNEDAGPHLIQRVIANLRAAVGGPETRATLEQGRLVRDVGEQEMTSLFGTAAAGMDAPPAKAKAEGAKAEPKADAKALERARAKEHATAEREVEKLRKANTAARKQVESAELAVTAAREALATAEKRVAVERAAATTAADALARAEAKLARLSTS